MYLGHFRLRKPPFSLTPDPSFLFMSRDHRDALAHLLYGVRDSVGFVQLTGEVGTGKTTLCRYLLEQTHRTLDVALILNPRQTAVELLASICDELGIPYPGAQLSAKTLVDRLNRYLLDRHRQGRRTVLVIDEAQNLGTEVLEQIRLLTNLETATAKLLQIVLIGQPELRTLMNRQDLRQLDQRIVARYHLTPLSPEETAAYVRHRLKVAGGAETLFSDRALRRVHALSGGVPRLVNVICDRALLGAYARNLGQVDGAMVRRAYRDIRGEPASQKWARFGLRPVLLGGSALAGIAAAILIATYGVQPNRPVTAAPEPAIAAPAPATPAPPGDPAGHPSTPAPVDTSFDILDSPEALRAWLGSATVQTSQAAAFSTLMTYWNVDAGNLDGAPGCQEASKAGLQCIEQAGGAAELAALNRPAVLELRGADKAVHHVVLAEIAPSGMVLDASGQRRALTAETLGALWSGGFILLWRPPPLESTELQKGMTGKDVLWLRRRLDRVEGLPMRSASIQGEPVFDDLLEARVKAFQAASGLAANGVAGWKTLMALESAEGDPTVPLLTTGSRNRKG